MAHWWAKPPRIHLFTGVWAAVILVLSATPGRELPQIAIEHLDKAVHVVIYAILLILFASSLKANRVGHPLIHSFIWVCLYGLAIEFMQGNYFEGRTFDSLDVLANGVGAAVGIVIFMKID